MTKLVVCPENAPLQPSLRTSAPAEIAAHLASYGVVYEQWTADAHLADDADQAAVLSAYASSVARIKAQGFGTVDVARIAGDVNDPAFLITAAGARGIAIFDIENPEQAKVDQIYDAEGRINDAHDIKLGATYPSQFGYVADGKNGLRVLQLTTPETPGSAGFSPRPVPMLVSNYKMKLGGHGHHLGQGRWPSIPITMAATR